MLHQEKGLEVAGRLYSSSDPKRQVRPASGTAGLAKAFSEATGPGCGKTAFQNRRRARPGLSAGFRL